MPPQEKLLSDFGLMSTVNSLDANNKQKTGAKFNLPGTTPTPEQSSSAQPTQREVAAKIGGNANAAARIGAQREMVTSGAGVADSQAAERQLEAQAFDYNNPSHRAQMDRYFWDQLKGKPVQIGGAIASAGSEVASAAVKGAPGAIPPAYMMIGGPAMIGAWGGYKLAQSGVVTWDKIKGAGNYIYESFRNDPVKATLYTVAVGGATVVTGGLAAGALGVTTLGGVGVATLVAGGGTAMTVGFAGASVKEGINARTHWVQSDEELKKAKTFGEAKAAQDKAVNAVVEGTLAAGDVGLTVISGGITKAVTPVVRSTNAGTKITGNVVRAEAEEAARVAAARGARRTRAGAAAPTTPGVAGAIPDAARTATPPAPATGPAGLVDEAASAATPPTPATGGTSVVDDTTRAVTPPAAATGGADDTVIATGGIDDAVDVDLPLNSSSVAGASGAASTRPSLLERARRTFSRRKAPESTTPPAEAIDDAARTTGGTPAAASALPAGATGTTATETVFEKAARIEENLAVLSRRKATLESEVVEAGTSRARLAEELPLVKAELDEATRVAEAARGEVSAASESVTRAKELARDAVAAVEDLPEVVLKREALERARAQASGVVSDQEALLREATDLANRAKKDALHNVEVDEGVLKRVQGELSATQKELRKRSVDFRLQEDQLANLKEASDNASTVFSNARTTHKDLVARGAADGEIAAARTAEETASTALHNAQTSYADAFTKAQRDRQGLLAVQKKHSALEADVARWGEAVEQGREEALRNPSVLRAERRVEMEREALDALKAPEAIAARTQAVADAERELAAARSAAMPEAVQEAERALVAAQAREAEALAQQKALQGEVRTIETSSANLSKTQKAAEAEATSTQRIIDSQSDALREMSRELHVPATGPEINLARRWYSDKTLKNFLEANGVRVEQGAFGSNEGWRQAAASLTVKDGVPSLKVGAQATSQDVLDALAPHMRDGGLIDIRKLPARDYDNYAKSLGTRRAEEEALLASTKGRRPGNLIDELAPRGSRLHSDAVHYYGKVVQHQAEKTAAKDVTFLRNPVKYVVTHPGKTISRTAVIGATALILSEDARNLTMNSAPGKWLIENGENALRAIWNLSDSKLNGPTPPPGANPDAGATLPRENSIGQVRPGPAPATPADTVASLPTTPPAGAAQAQGATSETSPAPATAGATATGAREKLADVPAKPTALSIDSEAVIAGAGAAVQGRSAPSREQAIDPDAVRAALMLFADQKGEFPGISEAQLRKNMAVIASELSTAMKVLQIRGELSTDTSADNSLNNAKALKLYLSNHPNGDVKEKASEISQIYLSGKRPSTPQQEENNQAQNFEAGSANPQLLGEKTQRSFASLFDLGSASVIRGLDKNISAATKAYELPNGFIAGLIAGAATPGESGLVLNHRNPFGLTDKLWTENSAEQCNRCAALAQSALTVAQRASSENPTLRAYQLLFRDSARAQRAQEFLVRADG